MHPKMVATRPNAATISAPHCGGPVRTVVDHAIRGSSNMKCATIAPMTPPAICAPKYAGASRMGNIRRRHSAAVTAGLKWAPESGPKTRMSTIRMAPVAAVFASSATASFPAASRSPMIPEPTTVATRIPVPSASEARRRPRWNSFMRRSSAADCGLVVRPFRYRFMNWGGPRRRGWTVFRPRRRRPLRPARRRGRCAPTRRGTSRWIPGTSASHGARTVRSTA